METAKKEVKVKFSLQMFLGWSSIKSLEWKHCSLPTRMGPTSWPQQSTQEKKKIYIREKHLRFGS